VDARIIPLNVLPVISDHGGHLYTVGIQHLSLHRVNHAKIDHLIQGHDVVGHPGNVMRPNPFVLVEIRAFKIFMTGHTGKPTGPQIIVVPHGFPFSHQFIQIGYVLIPNRIFLSTWVTGIAGIARIARVTGVFLVTRIARVTRIVVIGVSLGNRSTKHQDRRHK